VDITLENQTLTISAQRREETQDGKKGELLLNERRFSQFLRSFTLPPTVDEQTVNAKLNDGVLTVTLNKREESSPVNSVAVMFDEHFGAADLYSRLLFFGFFPRWLHCASESAA